MHMCVYMHVHVACIIGVSRSEPHINHLYEKIAVLIYVCMYVCMYVCVCVCVPIRRLHVRDHHACMCAQMDTVKIISVDHVLTLNVAHQATEA